MKENIDNIVKLLNALIPAAEIIDIIGSNLCNDPSCPPRMWIKKYSLHAETLFEIGNEQTVLLATPKWFVEKIDIENLDFQKILYDDEKIILSSIKDIDRILTNQAIHAYERGDYTIAVTALSVFLEGLIAEHVGNDNSWSTKIRRNVEFIIDNCKKGSELFDCSLDKLCLYVTLKNALDIYAADSSFADNEPEYINRHWIAHGRSRKEYTRVDCLKIMSIVGGVNKL